MISDLASYVDCCDECRPRTTTVTPVLVRPAENGHGEVADYLCPFGHTWHTGWFLGDEQLAA